MWVREGQENGSDERNSVIIVQILTRQDEKIFEWKAEHLKRNTTNYRRPHKQFEVISPASRLVGIELNPGPSSSSSSSSSQSLINRLHSIELQLIMHFLDIRHRIIFARLTRSTLQMCENTSFAWQNALLPLRLPNVMKSSNVGLEFLPVENSAAITSAAEDAATTSFMTPEFAPVSNDALANTIQLSVSSRLLRHCPIALSIHTQDFVHTDQLTASLTALSTSSSQSRIIELEIHTLEPHDFSSEQERDDVYDDRFPSIHEAAIDVETGLARPFSRYMVLAQLLADEKNEMRNHVHTLRLMHAEYRPEMKHCHEWIPEYWIEPCLTLPRLTSLHMSTSSSDWAADLIMNRASSGLYPPLRHLSFDSGDAYVEAIDRICDCAPLQHSLRSLGLAELTCRSWPHLERLTQLTALHLMQPHHRALSVLISKAISCMPNLRRLYITTVGYHKFPDYFESATFAEIDRVCPNLAELIIAVGTGNGLHRVAMRDHKEFIKLYEDIRRLQDKPDGTRLKPIFLERDIVDKL